MLEETGCRALARRVPHKALPPVARCCRGPRTTQLKSGPMAAWPRHRPAPTRPNGSAAGHRPVPVRANSGVATRGGRPKLGAEAGRWPPAPPRSPLTRCLVSPSSCSKPRGRAGGCGAEGGNLGGPPPLSPPLLGSRPLRPFEVAVSRCPAPLRSARTWRPRRTPSATRAATSCANVSSCPP